VYVCVREREGGRVWPYSTASYTNGVMRPMCVCVRVYTYIRVCMCVRDSAPILHRVMCQWRRAPHVCMYIHTCMCVCVWERERVAIFHHIIYPRCHVPYVCLCMCIYTYVRVCVREIECSHIAVLCTCISYVRVRVYARACICIHTLMCMCARTCVCICMCAYTYQFPGANSWARGANIVQARPAYPAPRLWTVSLPAQDHRGSAHLKRDLKSQ